MQTRALVDFGELSLNRAMRIYGSVGDLSVFEGRYYPSKAPLMSFAATPIYAVLRELAGGRPGLVPEIPLVFFSRLFLTILPTLLSLVLFERFLAHYVERHVALAVTWTYALGTLAFSYSLLFMSHQTTATLLFVGFYLCWRVLRGERRERWLALAGLLLGLAVVAEYTSALPVLAIAAYATLGGKGRTNERLGRVLLGAAGAVPAVMFLGWYHQVCFGGVLETGYRHLADLAYQPWHEGGVLGIKSPTWSAFSGSFFSPLRGLFSLSPFLLLGFVGIPSIYRERTKHPEFRGLAFFTALLTAAYAYFTSSFSYESWGWTTGPRHLTGLVPFLLLPAAVAAGDSNARGRRALATGLAVSAILVTSALTFVNYIPDDMSEGVFGLFVPLAIGGNVAPSALGFMGVNAPLPGLFLFVIVCAATVLTAKVLIGAATKSQLSATAALAFLFLAGHRLSYRATEHDLAARELLKRVWLAKPGQDVAFWSTTGRPDQ